MVDLEDREAGVVFDALAVETARSILVELGHEPTVPSELADTVDSSLQNVTYHLDKLEAAGLVEVVDQWYSPKGAEMDVYAPAGVPVVVLSGDARGEDPAAAVDRPDAGDAGLTVGD